MKTYYTTEYKTRFGYLDEWSRVGICHVRGVNIGEEFSQLDELQKLVSYAQSESDYVDYRIVKVTAEVVYSPPAKKQQRRVKR